VELSNDNHIADSFLKRLIAEFNQQQHSPSADMTKTTVTLERDALPLLASNSNVIEKQSDCGDVLRASYRSVGCHTKLR